MFGGNFFKAVILIALTLAPVALTAPVTISYDQFSLTHTSADHLSGSVDETQTQVVSPDERMPELPNVAKYKTSLFQGCVQQSPQAEMRGPLRDDVGPDWIIFDNGNPQALITGAPYWTKVNFRPNVAFRLHAIRLFPLNQGNVRNRAMR